MMVRARTLAMWRPAIVVDEGGGQEVANNGGGRQQSTIGEAMQW